MKKIISLIAAAAILMSVSGCGKDPDKGTSIVGEGRENTGEKTFATLNPTAGPDAELTPLPTASATQAPFTESNEVKVVTAQEIPVAETKKEFEGSEAEENYVKYTSGDKKWGIQLPADAVPGDEDESGIVFMLNQNPIAVNTLDEPVELTSVEEAKQYYSVLADVHINNFTVIYDDGEYAGCCFDFEAPNGVFGFGKYAMKGGTGAAASAINLADDAALNDTLRDTVNSLVVFE